MAHERRSDKLLLARQLSEKPPKDNMPGQKFPRGALVRVCDEMPPCMSHFDSGFMAIVEYTYAQKYWGNNIESYSLIKLNSDGKPVGSSAWYREEQLTQVGIDTEKGLQIINDYRSQLLSIKKESIGSQGAKAGTELKEALKAAIKDVVKPLDIKYEPPPVDIVTINGVRYTGEFFRLFAFPNPDFVYSFERFGEDGAVMIHRHGTKKELGLC